MEKYHIKLFKLMIDCLITAAMIVPAAAADFTNGEEDMSAKACFLWDVDYLYVPIDTDDAEVISIGADEYETTPRPSIPVSLPIGSAAGYVVSKEK